METITLTLTALQLEQWAASLNVKPFLTFVVKGTEPDARAQLFARGILARTIGFTRTETVFKTSVEFRDAIAQWFNESPELIAGYGYPNGTCLLFSTHENGGN